MDATTTNDPDVGPGRGKARLVVVSDTICPWCYIGKRHMDVALARLAAEGLNVTVAWHAYQLNPDMPDDGADRQAHRIAKFGSRERATELEARVIAAAETADLPFRSDLILRTPNTVASHRLIWLAGRRGVQNAVVDRLFRAYFVDGLDIGDAVVLARCAGEAGIDEAAALAFLAGEEGRVEVLADDAAARRAGINGVPSFALDGHLVFSGAMPAETMADAFRRALAILRERAA